MKLSPGAADILPQAPEPPNPPTCAARIPDTSRTPSGRVFIFSNIIKLREDVNGCFQCSQDHDMRRASRSARGASHRCFLVAQEPPCFGASQGPRNRFVSGPGALFRGFLGPPCFRASQGPRNRHVSGPPRDTGTALFRDLPGAQEPPFRGNYCFRGLTNSWKLVLPGPH